LRTELLGSLSTAGVNGPAICTARRKRKHFFLQDRSRHLSCFFVCLRGERNCCAGTPLGKPCKRVEPVPTWGVRLIFTISRREPRMVVPCDSIGHENASIARPVSPAPANAPIAASRSRRMARHLGTYPPHASLTRRGFAFFKNHVFFFESSHSGSESHILRLPFCARC
jgi:hypothetical protein